MSFLGTWYNEVSSNDVVKSLAVEKNFFSGKTEFQNMEIIQTKAYGKPPLEVLVLDGQIQSSQIDEFIYHESLVQPALFSHPKPKRVFIGGGGEGATAREVLRHSSVVECVMVDIDSKVCSMCEEHLPEWSAGAYKDERFKLVCKDAKEALSDYEDGYFDIIILDLCDPLEYGPCYKLYSTEFYNMCYDKLSKNGVFVTQSGPAAIINCTDVYTPINSTLRHSRFPHVYAYQSFVVSFDAIWGFNMALKENDTSDEEGSYPVLPSDNMIKIKSEDVDAIIAKRINEDDFGYYSGASHTNMFHLPKYLSKSLKEEKRVICEETPIFVSHISSDH